MGCEGRFQWDESGHAPSRLGRFSLHLHVAERSLTLARWRLPLGNEHNTSSDFTIHTCRSGDQTVGGLPDFDTGCVRPLDCSCPRLFVCPRSFMLSTFQVLKAAPSVPFRDLSLLSRYSTYSTISLDVRVSAKWTSSMVLGKKS